MIALIPGEAEEPLFQDGVTPIPKPQSETHHLVTAADPADAVFSPAVGAGTRVVVREIFPSRAAGAVILADRSPLPLRKIGPPALPMLLAASRFFEPAAFSGLGSWPSWMAFGTKLKATVT